MNERNGKFVVIVCDQVQELFKNVERYHREVQDILKSNDMPPSEKVKQLLDQSVELDVEILELKSLKWVKTALAFCSPIQH